MKPIYLGALVALLMSAPVEPARAQEPHNEVQSSDPQLLALASEFGDWLAANRPVSPHAILRGARPMAWDPNWSRSALQQRKSEYLQFQGRHKAISTLGFNTGDRIDTAILGASMARVHWTLEVLDRPRRDPGFYLDQSLGSLFELLIQSPEPDEADVEELIRRLHRFTPLINAAKLELDEVVRSLAEESIATIGDANLRTDAFEAALSPYVSDRLRYDFNVGIRAMRQSLSTFKDWLTVSLERFRESPAIGIQRYRWYLGHVALVPRSPEALLVESELALARAGAELAVTAHRFSDQLAQGELDSAERLVQMAAISQQEIATFLSSAGLVSGMEATEAFALAMLPATLLPLRGIGERVDFGLGGSAETRRFLLGEKAGSSLLERYAWSDPRLLICWDGVPGRHAQVRAASGHARLIRRSASNASLSEGVALYFNALVREAGLYAFKPASRMMALALLRRQAALANADVQIALGDWDIEEAVDFLVVRGGLERADATHSVWQLVRDPGRAGAAFAAYGQLVRFLADAAGALDDAFELDAFNDRVLLNAHVPIALQRWEYLGIEDELDQLVEQRGRPATVPE